MTREELSNIQNSRGTSAIESADSVAKDIAAVVRECRQEIEKNAFKLRDAEPRRRKEAIKNIIIEYVNKKCPLAEGFVTIDGKADTTKLIDYLVNEITDLGKLTRYYDDPACTEIQCNGREIRAEVNGELKPITDKDGNIIEFASYEEQEVIISKLLGTTRFTPKDQVVGCRTPEGYRIMAVHSTAISPDPQNPMAEVLSAFVLRKFKEEKMLIPDIISLKTMSDDMGRFMSLFMDGHITFITVGPTGSGKTTTNNAIMKNAADDLRTILVQNPSEIDLRKKDEQGRVKNNVLHLESVNSENPTSTTATAENLMDAILRLTPEFCGFGEIRTDIEFVNATKLGLAGHPFTTTYHAEDAEGAFYRYVQAYVCGCPGVPVDMIIRMLCGIFNIIIVQKKYPDKKRRVSQITEVAGYDAERQQPILRDLYRYEITGDPEYDANHRVIKMNGEHKRVGRLSERTLKKLKEQGIASYRYDFLDKEVDENEVQHYTAKNILDYGF